MRKIFIIGFTLWFPSICMASEPERADASAQAPQLLHKVEINSETGDMVFYPARYENLEHLQKEYCQKEYVTELLTKRLTLLVDFRKSLKKFGGSKAQSNYDHYKVLFDSNEIALRENAAQGVLNPILFYGDYGNDENLTAHAISVAILLKQRLEESLADSPQSQQKIDSLIRQVSKFIEQNTKRQIVSVASIKETAPASEVALSGQKEEAKDINASFAALSLTPERSADDKNAFLPLVEQEEYGKSLNDDQGKAITTIQDAIRDAINDLQQATRTWQAVCSQSQKFVAGRDTSPPSQILGSHQADIIGVRRQIGILKDNIQYLEQCLEKGTWSPLE
jgi:hypothetical protein